jgi:hypothetical protein
MRAAVRPFTDEPFTYRLEGKTVVPGKLVSVEKASSIAAAVCCFAIRSPY